MIRGLLERSIEENNLDEFGSEWIQPNESTKKFEQTQIIEKIDRGIREDNIQIKDMTNQLKKIENRLKNTKRNIKTAKYLEIENNELRKELRDLKQSNTRLINKNDVLEQLVIKKDEEIENLLEEIKDDKDTVEEEKIKRNSLINEMQDQKFTGKRNTEMYLEEIKVLNKKLDDYALEAHKDDILIIKLKEEIEKYKVRNYDLTFEIEKLLGIAEEREKDSRLLFAENIDLKDKLQEAQAQSVIDQNEIEQNIVLLEKLRNDYDRVIAKLQELETKCEDLTAENNLLKEEINLGT